MQKLRLYFVAINVTIFCFMMPIFVILYSPSNKDAALMVFFILVYFLLTAFYQFRDTKIGQKIKNFLNPYF